MPTPNVAESNPGPQDNSLGRRLLPQIWNSTRKYFLLVAWRSLVSDVLARTEAHVDMSGYGYDGSENELPSATYLRRFKLIQSSELTRVCKPRQNVFEIKDSDACRIF
ncbi:hypothetical protein HMN09_01115900 [Mycena chlorophos]|uniref:Uncharacterized protein n=1 Tax=Mycena chlorophos TaxID=658473 RepID=A0A8H6SBJ8_MYCCL|nr:hypothetical protein HMN09_01115900 [Mycena chlorophos]